jgi:hypothetical protein
MDRSSEPPKPIRPHHPHARAESDSAPRTQCARYMSRLGDCPSGVTFGSCTSPLSPHEQRAARELERGESKQNPPPAPEPPRDGRDVPPRPRTCRSEPPRDGRDAFHRVPVLAGVNLLGMVGTRSTASPCLPEVRDAVERAPTRFRGAKRESLRGIVSPRLAATE